MNNIIYITIIAIILGYHNNSHTANNRQNQDINLVFLDLIKPGQKTPIFPKENWKKLKKNQKLSKYKTELLTYSVADSITNYHVLIEQNSEQIIQAINIRFPNNLWHDAVLREIHKKWPKDKITYVAKNNSALFTWSENNVSFRYEAACVKICFAITLNLKLQNSDPLYLPTLFEF
jgi:hypothetical protein